MSPKGGGLYLALGFALAGSATTAAKPLAGSLGPFALTACSLAFALPVLAPFALKRPRPSLAELGRTALLGFFGIFLYRFFLVSALSRVGAAEAGLMTGAAPALTAIGAWAFLGERPSLRGILGVGAVCLGLLAIDLGGAAAAAALASGDRGPGRSIGLLLALGAAASEAAFALLSRRAWLKAEGGDPRSRTALTAAWAFLFALGPALAERPFPALAALGPRSWLALAWYGLFVTAASYICWYEGIRRSEAARAAAFTGIVPLVSLILPLLLLGERPGIASLAGCALIGAGILCSSGVMRIRKYALGDTK